MASSCPAVGGESSLAFCNIPLASALPVFVACTTTLLLSMALWRTPVVALMSDVTPSRFRSQANGVTNFMGGIGVIIASLGGAALFEVNPAYPFWMGSGLIILAAVILLVFIREPKEFESTSEDQPSLVESLRTVLGDEDRSALRVLLAISFWFITYNAIEAFFTLYAKNHLGLPGEDGARLLGQFALTLVLFALPSGAIGGRLGRRRSIIIGISGLVAALLAIFFSPRAMLVIPLTRLPVLGTVPVLGVILMVGGASWAMVNVNSLPMVVDMTDDLRVGTYTGLYYFFATLSAIAGPNINGWIVQLSGRNYNAIMMAAPLFMIVALILMLGVRKGEAKASSSPVTEV